MTDIDAIPVFNNRPLGDSEVGVSGSSSALAGGTGGKSASETLAIILLAVVIVGSVQIALSVLNVPQYVFPKPSEIGVALVKEFPLIAPHLVYTLVELAAASPSARRPASCSRPSSRSFRSRRRSSRHTSSSL